MNLLNRMDGAGSASRGVGLVCVLVAHGALLYGLWSHRLIPSPQEAVTLFVDFIAPPPRVEEPPRRQPPQPVRQPPQPRPRPAQPPQPRQIVAEAPLVSSAEPLAPPPLPAPAEEASPTPAEEAQPAPRPAGPINLGPELSVACPQRTAPKYPPLSRRFGEEGMAVLRVELDEQGHVASVRVATGSGHARLDEAALAAVRTWRCNPARRDGRPARAVALQPFKFMLEGH